MGSSSETEGLSFRKKNPSSSSLLTFRPKSSPSSSHIPKPEDRKFLQPGLKTLIYAQEQPQNPRHIVHSTAIFRWPISSLSASVSQSLRPSWSSDTDDMLGSESGVYLSSTELKTNSKNGSSDRDHGKRNRRRGSEREFPPPIPLLARNGNLPGHMPWVLTRYCSDGRLILKEERVKHHEYFEAHREKGRLVLTLVRLKASFSPSLLRPIEMEDRCLEIEDGESEADEGDGEIYGPENSISNLFCNGGAAPENMIANLTQSSVPLVACN